jgi:CBS domain-containing protein
MASVGDILRSKGYSIWSTGPNTSVYEALQLMAEKNVGAVLVVESGKIAGIFSERDYARKVILKGKFSRDTAIREVMTEKVITVAPGQTVDDCMLLMTEKHIRHLPVVENGQALGVISIGDVVKAIISDQRFTINQLEDYITGKR